MVDEKLDNIVVVGKSCSVLKPNSCLSESHSRAILHPPIISDNVINKTSGDTSVNLQPSLSCSSFISAKSDLSNSKLCSKEVFDLEDDNSAKLLPGKRTISNDSSKEKDYLVKVCFNLRNIYIFFFFFKSNPTKVLFFK